METSKPNEKRIKLQIFADTDWKSVSTFTHCFIHMLDQIFMVAHSTDKSIILVLPHVTKYVRFSVNISPCMWKNVFFVQNSSSVHKFMGHKRSNGMEQ